MSMTEHGVTTQQSEEDVDGAQAIENESDYTDEVEGWTGPRKQ